MSGKAGGIFITIFTIATPAVAILGQGFSTENLSIIHLLQICGFFLLLVAVTADGAAVHREVLIWAVGLLLVLVPLSLINPVNYNGLYGFFHYFTLIIWYVVMCGAPGRERHWQCFMDTVLILGALTVFYALYQSYVSGVEAKAFFVQQNTCAAYLNIVIFLLLAGWRRLVGLRLQVISSIFLAVLYFALFTIAGRGALLGNLAGLLFVYYSLVRSGQGRRLKNMTVCILVTFVLAGVLNQWNVGSRFLDLGQDLVRIENAGGDAGNRSSVSERLLIFRAGLDMLHDTPWYGSGYGSFHMRYPAYQSLQDTSSGQYAHNDYLQVLIELGYPGLLLVAGLAVLIIYSLLMVIWKHRVRQADLPEIFALFALMTSISVHSLVSYNFYILPILILFSACLGRYAVLSHPEGLVTVKLDSKRGRRLFLFVSGGLCLFFMLVFILNISMNRAYEEGRELYMQDHIIAAEDRFIRAQRLFDTENIRIARALVSLSAARSITDKQGLAYRQLMQAGMQQLDRAGRMNPWLAQMHYVRGLYFMEFREVLSARYMDMAQREFETALLEDRRHLAARLELARMQVQAGDEGTALAILEQGLQHPLPDSPGIRDYLQTLIKLRQQNGYHKEAAALQRRLGSLHAGWQKAEKR